MLIRDCAGVTRVRKFALKICIIHLINPHTHMHILSFRGECIGKFVLWRGEPEGHEENSTETRDRPRGREAVC